MKSILRERDQAFGFIRGLVADMLRVDVEHAHTIEAALDGRDQWLIATDTDALLAARESFQNLEGRVNILNAAAGGTALTAGLPSVSPRSAEPQSPDSNSTVHELEARAAEEAYDWNRHPQRIRLAVDLVRFDPTDAAIAHHLLGRTVIVDDLDDAMALHRAGPRDHRYITRAGEVLEADGTLRTGPLTAAMGLLSRHAELEALAVQIADVDRRIESLTHQLTEGNAAAKAVEEEMNALRNAVYASNTTKVELTSKIAQNNDRRSALQRELPVLDRELQAMLDQTGRLKSEETELAERRGTLEADQASRQGQIEELTARHQRIGEDLKQWGEQLTTARVELGQIQEKQLASQQQVQRQTAARAEFAEQIERIARSERQLVGRRESVDTELATARHAETDHQNRLAVLAEDSQALAGRIEGLSTVVKELGEQVDGIRETHNELEQAFHQLEMKRNELRIRLESLVQRTMEELELDLPAKYAGFSEPLEDGTPGPGYQPADMDWDAVAAEIKELRDKIQRLGNVNLDSLGEQEELEQRQQFLAAQVTDLTESKRQLEELIDTINTESGLRFEQTFNAVREHFQGMFRKLFGGGKADIYLETELHDKDADQQPVLGPDGQTVLPVMRKTIDILDAGIEIIARPPGKQPVGISQLSGGEKTMTCVALLMSIFKSKPSPFCILDEVDAALDEANNQRFNLIVQEFLEQSQFIVITHSKRTMQIADVLYGVTMQEQGVSKRVAVKFDQVDSQGRIAETAAA